MEFSASISLVILHLFPNYSIDLTWPWFSSGKNRDSSLLVKEKKKNNLTISRIGSSSNDETSCFNIAVSAIIINL